MSMVRFLGLRMVTRRTVGGHFIVFNSFSFHTRVITSYSQAAREVVGASPHPFITSGSLEIIDNRQGFHPTVS